MTSLDRDVVGGIWGRFGVEAQSSQVSSPGWLPWSRYPFVGKFPRGGGGLGYTKPPTQAGTRSSIYHQGRLFQLSLVVVATKAPEVRLLRYSRRRVRGATYTVGIGAECHRGSVPRVLRRAWYPENRGAIASTGHRSPEISPLKPLSQALTPL